MVEKWDPGPLGPPGFLGSPEPSGPSGTLGAPSNLRDPAEPLGTPRISLGPPWDHRYSSGCDT